MRRGLAVMAALMFFVTSTPARADQPEPVRIMLVGDSTTQGVSGDWTWRYRLWNHLRAAGVDADFVGPRTDMYDLRSQSLGSHDYADPAFDQDHAARWQTATVNPPAPMDQLVADYEPDVVLILLGVNDLVGYAGTAAQVVEGLRLMVEQARAAKPDVAVILGTLPWTWIGGTAEVNGALPDMAAGLTTSASPIGVASFGAFTECAQTYDRVHLSAAGEQQVAAGFADELARFGVGTAYPRPLPAVPDVPRGTATLSAVPGSGAVTLSWIGPPGATHEVVWLRDVTAGEAWATLPLPIAGDGFTAQGLRNGHTYQFRVQAGKGCRTSDLFSAVVCAQPRDSRLSRLKARSSRRGVIVSWNPVLSATVYRVAWGKGRARLVHRPRATLPSPRRGRPYRITVSVPGMPGQTLTTTARPKRTKR